MLAEIFILRLEAMLRASEQADRERNYRFVPLADNLHIAPTGPEAPIYKETEAALKRGYGATTSSQRAAR
jgi:hypothetical protein